MDVRQRTEEIEHMTFAPWATFSDQSRGRMLPEEQDLIRPVFQRDRDRVLHCKAFRRLKQKTQVFLSPEGDLYRTRLDPYAGGLADRADHCPRPAAERRSDRSDQPCP